MDVLPLLTLYDLHGLGYVLLDLVLASLCSSPNDVPGAKDELAAAGARSPPELQSLKRLVEDVFQDDVEGGFRDYCLEEPGWGPAVEFLDENDRGGWCAPTHAWPLTRLGSVPHAFCFC
eukprot:scaffold65650_cov33-Tisochrysis_lutea.AAC.3